MEDPRGPLVYLSSDDVIYVNKQVIRDSGGFWPGAGIEREPGTVSYICEMAAAQFFGVEVCPTLAETAAFYAFAINTRHVFVDGNKRTSMVCALWFLLRNGATLSDTLSNDAIVATALAIARGEMAYDELTDWFRQIIVD